MYGYDWGMELDPYAVERFLWGLLWLGAYFVVMLMWVIWDMSAPKGRFFEHERALHRIKESKAKDDLV